ncbi:uncharacterized protein LOC129229357 [Uloborus diversus]|uniref:uncharacterized protein LOC129229357 n=1 Tax=Uloborus diversus TaxID=327109 RepID=UPI00240A2E4B|nr:uncharacterized protein LOC129229357 [Uloborus diversus]
MSSEARDALIKWHKEHQSDSFDFQKEMETYCRSDVDILRRSCMLFRSEFLEITGVDPLCYITIASACMAAYRSRHIPPSAIAMVPIHGYVNQTNYSVDSIRWLDWVASREKVNIQHALNGAGEKRFPEYRLTDIVQKKNTVYQYHVRNITH